MAANKPVEEFEYVTQFFGFTPKSFADGIYNAINDYIKLCFEEMCNILNEEFAKPNEDNISSLKIREGCKKIVDKCCRNLDRLMDKMELYMLRNIFIIPKDVVLPEDRVHCDNIVVNADEKDVSSTVSSEIIELTSAIKREIAFKEKLHREKIQLQATLADFKRLQLWFDDMNATITAGNLQEVLTSASLDSSETKSIVNSQDIL